MVAAASSGAGSQSRHSPFVGWEEYPANLEPSCLDMTPSQAAAYNKHVKTTSISYFAGGVMKVHIITAKAEGPETVSIKRSFLNTEENLLDSVQVSLLFKS
jgi:hypothetical protein